MNIPPVIVNTIILFLPIFISIAIIIGYKVKYSPNNMIVVQCRHCKSTYTVRKSRIGLIATCPACQSNIKIPRSSIYFGFYHIIAMVIITFFSPIILGAIIYDITLHVDWEMFSFLIFMYITPFVLVTALIARNKGRDLFTWWLYSFFLLPVAFLHSLLISRKVIVESELVFTSKNKS